MVLVSYFLSLTAAAAAATTTNTNDDYDGNGDADADVDQHELTHRTIYDRPVTDAQVALNRAQASA